MLGEQRYCVQSADFIDLPLDEKRFNYLEQNRLELFVEDAPDERAGTFATLEEAIRAQDAEFSNK